MYGLFGEHPKLESWGNFLSCELLKAKGLSNRKKKMYARSWEDGILGFLKKIRREERDREREGEWGKHGKMEA